MVAGKPRDYRLGSGLVEIVRTKSSMVQIGGQSAGWTQTQFRQRAGSRPSEDTEASMSLPDVMEKRSAGQISAPRRQQTHLLSGSESVPPIRASLPEKEGAFGTVVEQRFDEDPF